jgi:hypothetical protein
MSTGKDIMTNMFVFWGREVYLSFYVGEFLMFQMMSEHSKVSPPLVLVGGSQGIEGGYSQSQIIESKISPAKFHKRQQKLKLFRR